VRNVNPILPYADDKETETVVPFYYRSPARSAGAGQNRCGRGRRDFRYGTSSLRSDQLRKGQSAQAAESLGLDPKQILKDLPELSKLLTEGMPPLEQNSLLRTTALNHTRDMLARNYYGKIGPDGRSVFDRIIESGYDPELFGESLGVIAFYNLIDPEKAVYLLFKNMLREELNPVRVEPRYILGPGIREVGIGIGTGAMNLGAGQYNVYVATCDFGAPRDLPMKDAELAFLYLINQARANPLAMAQTLGLDPEKILENLPEWRDLLTDGLPPLGFDARLHQSASEHCRDMVEKGYFSELSPEGTPPADRIFDAGYDAWETGEVIGSLGSSDFLGEEGAAFQIFTARFKEELNPERTGQLQFLNPDFKDVGVSLKSFPLQGEGVEAGAYTLLVVDLGESSTPSGSFLTGVVYQDTNGDGLYGFGEGISSLPVTVEGSGRSFTLLTDPAGGVTLPLDPGLYTVAVDLEGSLIKRVVELREKNVGVWFKLDPVAE
jgi:uncharacterized protein YkwD